MEKKMTKREMFEQIKANYTLTAEEIEFIDHEIELLNKKNVRKSDKPTKAQIANEGLKDAILELLADGKARTITEITEGCEALEGASPQKVSALLTQLKKAGLVVREEIKRKAYFSIA